MNQYRINANGTIHNHGAYPGEQWSKCAEYHEQRGGTFTLERRYVVAKDDVCDMWPDGYPAGTLTMGGKVAFPWETIAEFTDRRGPIIIG